MKQQTNEKDNHEPLVTIPTGSNPPCTRKKLSKTTTKSTAQHSNADVNGLNPAPGCRYDSSLGLLTKKFFKLIQEAKDGTLDLNKTAEVLEVKKRRIYDITNVLEGIELVEKSSKSHIQWKGYDGCGSKELDDCLNQLKTEVETLRAHDHKLDESIRQKQDSLRALQEDENKRRYLFMTEEDITSLPCFQNRTLIAVKAPQASYLEVPDPDEDICSRQYKMIIRSNTGPIDLYLLSPQGVEIEGSSLDHRQNPDHAPTQCSSLYSESSGIQKIIPSDSDVNDDYWFQTEPEVTISQLWGEN